MDDLLQMETVYNVFVILHINQDNFIRFLSVSIS